MKYGIGMDIRECDECNLLFVLIDKRVIRNVLLSKFVKFMQFVKTIHSILSIVFSKTFFIIYSI